MTPALEFRSVSYAYPDGKLALADCSLRIERGERVALLGPNGAGKTTLALHANGVLMPARGDVVVEGAVVTKDNLKAVRKAVGIVFQDPDDQLFMPSVMEDVTFGPRNLGLDPVEERARTALDAVGMEDHARRPPHHLSFGQRRRVAIATVLAMDPSILVLDEPTSNLDPASRRELSAILDKLELTLVMATHDLPYALQMCERSVIVDSGTIVADGPTADILGDPELLAAHRLELPYAFDPEKAVERPTRS